MRTRCALGWGLAVAFAAGAAVVAGCNEGPRGTSGAPIAGDGTGGAVGDGNGGGNGGGGACVPGGSGGAAALAFRATHDELTPNRSSHLSAPLYDGRVLIVGGGPRGNLNVLTVEIYDPATDEFTAAGTLPAQISSGGTATALTDGRVLLTGFGNSARTELYYPAGGTFSAGPAMPAERSFHTATRLNDGRVLLVGGITGSALQPVAEIFDPSSNTLSATGSLVVPRTQHEAVLLADGQVLVVGGRGSLLGEPLREAEVFDPSTGAFTATATPTVMGRVEAALALLPDGRVLVTGGYVLGAALNIAETYNPGARRFITVSHPMQHARYRHTSTLLADGRHVLLTGGVGFDEYGEFGGGYTGEINVAETYDITTNRFTAFPMLAPRSRHTATLLPDGHVLVVGGLPIDGDDPNPPHVGPSAELFLPEVAFP